MTDCGSSMLAYMKMHRSNNRTMSGDMMSFDKIEKKIFMGSHHPMSKEMKKILNHRFKNYIFSDVCPLKFGIKPEV